MGATQLELFKPTLGSVGLLERLAGAEAVLASDPDLSRDERMELLLLVVAPGLATGAER
jgi:hypothetical protein